MGDPVLIQLVSLQEEIARWEDKVRSLHANEREGSGEIGPAGTSASDPHLWDCDGHISVVVYWAVVLVMVS